MKKAAHALSTLALCLPLVGCAGRQAEPVLSGTLEESLVEVTAVVEEVDATRRTLTIRRPGDAPLELAVDAPGKNLPRVEPGDEVILAYYESIVFDVREPGSDAKPAVTARPSTPIGAEPNAARTRMVTVTATIEGIDLAAPSVTLRGPEGAERTIKVRDPKKLDDVRVGDLVEIHFTQAVAVAMRRSHTP